MSDANVTRLLATRTISAQARFFAHVASRVPANPWIRIVEGGFANAADVIATLARSGGDPAVGDVFRLWASGVMNDEIGKAGG
jgi:hypothetical protein